MIGRILPVFVALSFALPPGAANAAERRYAIGSFDRIRIEGPFQVTGLEFKGDHAGEVAYDLALESAGALSFAAL